MHNLDYDDLRKIFQDETDKFYARYDDTIISIDFVMEILCIKNKDTVMALVKQRKITPLNPGSNTYRFRMSDILRYKAYR